MDRSGITVALGGLVAITLTVAYTFGAARRIFFGPLNPALEAKDAVRPSMDNDGSACTVIAVTSIVLGMYPRLVMDLLDTVLGGI